MTYNEQDEKSNCEFCFENSTRRIFVSGAATPSTLTRESPGSNLNRTNLDRAKTKTLVEVRLSFRFENISCPLTANEATLRRVVRAYLSMWHVFEEL